MTEDPTGIGQQPPSNRRDVWQRLFWVAFFLTPAMSLAAFGLGHVSKDTGATIGVLAFFVGGVCALYCGIWLARRWFKSTPARVIGSIVMFAMLGIFNLVISVAGCANSMDFR